MSSKLNRRTFGKNLMKSGALLAGSLALPAWAQKKAEPSLKKRFLDKVVLITGATSGIGEGCALRFAEEGAKVFFCGRRKEAGEKVVAKIKKSGGEADFFQADLQKKEDLEAFFKACLKRHNRIDIAINNAGIDSPAKPFTEITDDEWADVLNTNTTAVFRCMQAEIKQMLKQNSGVMINTASVFGHRCMPQIPAYIASKHAVVGLSRAAALEYKNIRINSISPGITKTPMIERQIKRSGDQKSSENEYAQLHTLERTAEISEVVSAMLWLASDEATFVHGSDFVVDGGFIRA